MNRRTGRVYLTEQKAQEIIKGPWFVAKDIAEALGCKKIIERNSATLQRGQEVKIMNEPNV